MSSYAFKIKLSPSHICIIVPRYVHIGAEELIVLFKNGVSLNLHELFCHSVTHSKFHGLVPHLMRSEN